MDKKNSQHGPDVLKLVHPGGVVEMHKKPVTAADIMKKNPRHCVTRPDVFKFPWIVVRPDAVLKPGNVFFVVPNHTMTRLLKQRKLGSFQEDEEQLAAAASSSPVTERKPGLFGSWGDHKERTGGIKPRFGFRKAGRRSQDEKRAGGFQFWGDDHHQEGGIKLGRFSFGRRSSGEAPLDHSRQFVKRESCESSRGRAKVDCRFDEDAQEEESIFPKCLVGRRTSFPKSNMAYNYDTPRRPFNGDHDWIKGHEYDAAGIMNHHHSYLRSQSFGFGYESDASSPEGLYGDQRTWFSLSIPTGESAVVGCRFPTDDGQEVDRITLKSCLKKDKLRRGVRVKFCRPGEDERKLRVEVFEFEP